DRLGLLLLPQQQLAADPSREAVGPGRLDQQPAGRAVAGLGEAAAFDAGTTRMLGWHQPEIGPSAGADWQSARGRPVRQSTLPHCPRPCRASFAAPPPPEPMSSPAASLRSAPSADRAGPRRLRPPERNPRARYDAPLART